MNANDITIESITEAGHDESDASLVRALCSHLGCQPDDLSRERYDSYGLAVFSCGREEYAIGTDSEADEAAKVAITDSAWAFNASFLSSFTDLPEEVFTTLQDKCEGAKDTFLTLIERADGGLDGFVSEAVSADGRGHFLSSYDGDENEETINGETFYIYRTN